jgi:hypothetical protein
MDWGPFSSTSTASFSSSRSFGPALGPASFAALIQLSMPLQVAWLVRRACRFLGVCAFTKRSRLERPACLSSTSLWLRPAGVLVGITRETEQVFFPVICSCGRCLSTVAETHRSPRQKEAENGPLLIPSALCIAPSWDDPGCRDAVWRTGIFCDNRNA